MKHTVRLDKNRYVQLDSYASHNETPVANFFVGIFVIAIAAMTVGAAFGIDITNINSNQNHEQPKR